MNSTPPNVWTEPFTQEILKSLQLEAARLFHIHQLPSDLEKWNALRNTLREKIWKSVGIRPNSRIDLDLRETKSILMDGYTIKNIYFQSQEGFYVTGNLYVPEGSGPFPGVLNVHGHHIQGRLAERVQARGHVLAKNGYVCLAVDAFGAGERSLEHGEYEYHGSTLGASLFNIGESLLGIQIVDNLRAIDLLTSLPFVQADKIGVTGASGGGNQTMWTAAMDDRVTASVPVVSVGTFESYIGSSNCICETLPDGLTYMEESAVLALMAPRAVKICNCLGDTNPAFQPREMIRSYTEARKVFQSMGVDDHLSYQIFNATHGYWPEIREAMIGWFDLHLRGMGHGAPKAEIPFRSLSEEDLMVFPKGKRPLEVESIADYCRRKGQQIRTQQVESPTKNTAQKLSELKDLLHLQSSLKIKHVHTYSSEGDWQRYAIESDMGHMIPLLIRGAKAGSDLYLLSHPQGKAQLENTQLYKEALASGAGLALIDLWGSGETADEDGLTQTASFHDLGRYCLWMGRTLMGEWVRDYLLIASYLESTFKESSLKLGGYGEAGLAALFASILSESSLPITLEDSPMSYVFHNEKAASEHHTSFYGMALHLPGILAWGDVALALKLAGDRVRLIQPRLSDGEIYVGDVKQDGYSW